MSYALPYTEIDQPLPATEPELEFVPRSKVQWIAFLPLVCLAAVSWIGGGIPFLTDLAFVGLTLVCAYFLFFEFFYFPRRFGIGGLLLYGGTLCWFCEDYCTHWLGHNYHDVTISIEPWVVAKSATWHMAFVMMMSIGLGINKGRFMEKIILSIPEPDTRGFYFWLMIALFAFGISPFFIFNKEPWYMMMYHYAFAGWTDSARFTVSRDGNVSANWGQYVAQILQVGAVGGIFAMMYAVLIARNVLEIIVGMTIWAYWLLAAFATDRRGEIAFTMMPLVALLFIRLQAKSAMKFKKHSVKAYVYCGLLTVILWAAVQFQGSFRGVGYTNANFEMYSFTKNQGNTMFSEGLLGFALIPDHKDYFYNTLPGEAFILPVPNTIFWFTVGIIPRALWVDKPIDPAWAWYNREFIGSGNGISGTTISHGLVGSWYFNYGFWGIIEGGMLVGWCMGVSERALQRSEGRPIGVLMSLGFAVWLFRIYRDWIFIDLYGLVLGGIVLWIMIKLLKPFTGGAPQPQLVMA